jgi:hypothetical protein
MRTKFARLGVALRRLHLRAGCGRSSVRTEPVLAVDGPAANATMARVFYPKCGEGIPPLAPGPPEPGFRARLRQWSLCRSAVRVLRAGCIRTRTPPHSSCSAFRVALTEDGRPNRRRRDRRGVDVSLIRTRSKGRDRPNDRQQSLAHDAVEQCARAHQSGRSGLAGGAEAFRKYVALRIARLPVRRDHRARYHR